MDSGQLSFVQRSLGDVVSENARAATVLERFGLDYCCNGHQTLEDAAADRGVPLNEVVGALAALGDPTPADRAPAEWEHLDALTGHIIERHHRYVRDTCPTVNAWLDKLVARHASRHPELEEVRQTFADLSDELMTHMMKEENVLFPFINDLAVARRAGTRPPAGPFGTILNPVRVMESDHQAAGELLARLRTLTNGYTAPDDGCTTYRLCYGELARFEEDLHRHIHLENNVLFPRALEIEGRLVN
jgi:regulator of cell morphogenesis and NO signaling